MRKSAERGKGCVMYKHTFHLVDGEEIVTYSKDVEIPTFHYGDVVAFVSDNGKMRYAIPVLSIMYVETEECE
jgi:hypothetical protein